MREGRPRSTAFLFGVLILSSGCQAVDGWATEEVIAYAEGPLLEDVERFVAETAGEEFQEWQDAADADQDGDTTWAEWWSFAFGSSGGVWLLWWLLRRISDRHRASVAARQAEPGPPVAIHNAGLGREPAVVLPGGRQAADAAAPRPWYELPVSTGSPMLCPPG